MQDYIKVVSKLEKKTRCCYFEAITMDRKKYLQMMLLDACFVLVKVDGTVISARPLVRKFTKDITDMVTDENEQEIVLESTEAVRYRNPENANATDKLILEDELRKAYDDETGTKNSERNSGCDVQHFASGDWFANAVWHDLFLLENQMPFFVIESIYEAVVGNSLPNVLIRDKFVECVEDILRHFPKGIQNSQRLRGFHHMLHLCHMYLRPTQKFTESQQERPKPRYFHTLIHFGGKCFGLSSKPRERELNYLPVQEGDCFRAGQLPIRWRRASQYHEAGIRLKKREYTEYDRHSLLDIKFQNGVIEIPCLLIDENTESLFKNLVALEQTDARFGNDLTAYVTSMSQLVSTPEDSALLAGRGIIVCLVDSDDEIPALFTRLSRQVTFYADSNYYLKYLCQTLEVHYQGRLNRWMAWLWINHFSNPWLALALVAAVIVLICTIVQTIYTVLAYMYPPF